MFQRLGPYGPEAETGCGKGIRELESRLLALSSIPGGFIKPSGVLRSFLVQVVCGSGKSYRVLCDSLVLVITCSIIDQIHSQ